MQLGTRWSFGGEPPARLPDAVVAAIAEVEARVPVETGGAVATGVAMETGVEVEARLEVEPGASTTDTQSWRWTLTWLEGRPVVELDDGTVIRVSADGSVSVHPGD